MSGRGLLAEFGHVPPLRAIEVQRRVPQLLGKLPTRVAACARDLLEHAARLAAKTLEYEHEIKVHVSCNALARRTQTRMGIGPITASALVATVGNGRDFKNGRQFAAWLGLVPRQYSTGGKTRLGHITKRGDPYLRTLLVMGARAVLQRAASRSVITLGTGGARAPRLPPRLHRDRGQECTCRLGIAGQGARHCLNSIVPRSTIEQEIGVVLPLYEEGLRPPDMAWALARRGLDTHRTLRSPDRYCSGLGWF
jgi:transposase IS116/IS110/IS902 family protein